MRRRTFLSALPAGALAATAAQSRQASPAAKPTEAAPAPTPLSARPTDPYAGIGIGDRVTGPKFVGRSTVWG